MGDHLCFRSQITNTGAQPIEGLVTWIGLVQVAPGHERPGDLEDWSAHQAVIGATLAPRDSLRSDWPIRLIQQGDYRVVISATGRNEREVFTSPTVQCHLSRKLVVKSARVLPMAVGIPLLLGGLMGYRLWRTR